MLCALLAFYWVPTNRLTSTLVPRQPREQEAVIPGLTNTNEDSRGFNYLYSLTHTFPWCHCQLQGFLSPPPCSSRQPPATVFRVLIPLHLSLSASVASGGYFLGDSLHYSPEDCPSVAQIHGQLYSLY